MAAENNEAVLNIMDQHRRSGDIPGFKLELDRLNNPSADQRERAKNLGRDPEIQKSVFLDAANADREGSRRELSQSLARARLLGMLDPEKAPDLYQHFAGYAKRAGISLAEPPYPELPDPRVVLKQPSATFEEIRLEDLDPAELARIIGAPVQPKVAPEPPAPAQPSSQQEVIEQINAEVSGQIQKAEEERIRDQQSRRRFGISNPFRRKPSETQPRVLTDDAIKSHLAGEIEYLVKTKGMSQEAATEQVVSEDKAKPPS